MQQSYAFLMNVRSLLDAQTFQLAEGHELRCANSDEIEGIKRTIDKVNVFSRYGYSEARLEEDGLVSLPTEEWRYHVVAFRGNDSILNELKTAFDLSHVELEVGFTIYHLDPWAGSLESIWSNARLFHVLETVPWSSDFLVDVSTADVSEIKAIHTSLRSYDHAVLDLKRFFIQMSHLKGLPHGSPLRFLGYFGILESLLTHNPRPNDTIDSITRQVKKKLTLLDRQFVKAIDYSGFGQVNPEKVWTKMYAYRSVIAHGGRPDFTRDLAVLMNPQQALKLLKETAKALIRHTLNEPQLIVDLREC